MTRRQELIVKSTNDTKIRECVILRIGGIFELLNGIREQEKQVGFREVGAVFQGQISRLHFSQRFVASGPRVPDIRGFSARPGDAVLKHCVGRPG